MRKVSDKEREKLSAKIASLESLDLAQLQIPMEASLRNRCSSTSEPGLAEASGCVPHPGERRSAVSSRPRADCLNASPKMPECGSRPRSFR